MQTTIGSTMGLGIPGEHGNTQPYFADAYIAGEAIVMGTPVVITDGKAMKATAAVADGLAVSPHEHVRMVLPDDTKSLEVKAGDTIAVAKKGCWFVKRPTGTVQTKMAVANGALTFSANGTFAEVLQYDDSVCLIRLI